MTATQTISWRPQAISRRRQPHRRYHGDDSHTDNITGTTATQTISRERQPHRRYQYYHGDHSHTDDITGTTATQTI